MELNTATPPQTSNSPFKDLFKPAMGNTASSDTSAATAANSATGPGAVTPGSEAAKNGTVSQESVFSNLGHTAISSTTVTGAPGAPGGTAGNASVSLGGMVQGEWAVNLMDAILPAAMVAAFYYFGVKLRKSELQLTQSEKNTIAPVMQKCLDTVLLNFNNPWNALIVTVGTIYAGKAAEKGIVAYIDKSQEKKESEALQAKLSAADKADNPAKFDPANQSADDIMNGNNVGAEGFTEAQIKAGVKQWKCSRAKVIERLKKERDKQW